jgi:LAO/AO transport system kinase
VHAVDQTIIELFHAGHVRGLARAISRSESGEGAVLTAMLYQHAGRAMTLGVTGSPGVGKSTLVAALVHVARAHRQRVGVVLVDPSSPFSRGAILGDRIRLSEHFTDADVFIRSMASRGHLGGLAGATGDAIMFMDAFGLDVIIVETVGVGQSEIEIAELVDTTLVVLQPGSGDSVQLLKAGILEIADIFILNKADHPAVLQVQREILSMLAMADFSAWQIPLLLTKAHERNGIEEVWNTIGEHAAYLRDHGEIERRRRRAFAHRVRLLALGTIRERLDREIDGHLARQSGELGNPYVVAESLWYDIWKGGHVPWESVS